MILSPRINTVSFLKASSFYVRGNPTLIADETINRPHLITEISPSKLPWKIPTHWVHEKEGLFFFF